MRCSNITGLLDMSQDKHCSSEGLDINLCYSIYDGNYNLSTLDSLPNSIGDFICISRTLFFSNFSGSLLNWIWKLTFNDCVASLIAICSSCKTRLISSPAYASSAWSSSSSLTLSVGKCLLTAHHIENLSWFESNRHYFYFPSCLTKAKLNSVLSFLERPC